MPVIGPHSNFNRVLTISKAGDRVTASGTLRLPDDDTEEIHVFGVVTQEPLESKPAADRTPFAVTCRGNVKVERAELRDAAEGGQVNWSFCADAVADTFRLGWARGTAIALEFEKNGDIETYSWSAWVWLEPETVSNP